MAAVVETAATLEDPDGLLIAQCVWGQPDSLGTSRALSRPACVYVHGVVVSFWATGMGLDLFPFIHIPILAK